MRRKKKKEVNGRSFENRYKASTSNQTIRTNNFYRKLTTLISLIFENAYVQGVSASVVSGVVNYTNYTNYTDNIT